MRTVALSVCALAISTIAASAEDVFFDGEVLTSCSILGHTDGALGVDLGSGGTILTSELPYGAPASVTVLSVGSNFLNVSSPTRTAQPASYVSTGESLEVSYLGVGALSTVSQTWTGVGTSQAATALLATALTVNSRITNAANGFPAGTYQTKVVVTCTPTAQF